MVDFCAKIEGERLFYIRREQGRLRVDSFGALPQATEILQIMVSESFCSHLSQDQGM